MHETLSDSTVPNSPPLLGATVGEGNRQVQETESMAVGRRRPSNGRADVAKRTTHRWARWLHVYSSMIALLIVLFFGITGITLNHPTWTFGDATSRSTTTGTLATATTLDDGSIDWLSVAEEVRATYNVKGTVSDFGATDGEGAITFVNPGYSADLFFDVSDASFELTVAEQGFVAVMNDLHKGRDSGSAWSWVIDVSAGFLVLISVTGLTMQFFLRKRRRSALVSAAVGGALSVALIWITTL